MTGSSTEFDKDPHLSQFDMVFEFTSRGEPYSPRAGDVFERGRHRILLESQSSGGTFWYAYTQYRRLFGNWGLWDSYTTRVVPGLLLADGWRVIYREPEAKAAPEQRSKP